MFLLFLILWIIFNARITVEILLFGIPISALCCGVTYYLFGFGWKDELRLWKKFPGILKLLAVLLAEIFKANMAVVRLIWSRREPKPEFVSFRVPLKSKLSRTVLADCITLTPGTITGSEENGEYTVHCLDTSLSDGLSESVFVQNLKALEGDK